MTLYSREISEFLIEMFVKDICQQFRLPENLDFN